MWRSTKFKHKGISFFNPIIVFLGSPNGLLHSMSFAKVMPKLNPLLSTPTPWKDQVWPRILTYPKKKPCRRLFAHPWKRKRQGDRPWQVLSHTAYTLTWEYQAGQALEVSWKYPDIIASWCYCLLWPWIYTHQTKCDYSLISSVHSATIHVIPY